MWDAPEKADILVSELLGSFGDNELSPECLDGAQRFLKGKIPISFYCSLLLLCMMYDVYILFSCTPIRRGNQHTLLVHVVRIADNLFQAPQRGEELERFETHGNCLCGEIA